MSTENPALAPATESVVSSSPVAPQNAGGTPDSTPAPVDTTASEAQPEADEAKKRQSRSESRAFATIRRENRELYRRLGAMEERLALSQQQPRTEGEQPTPRVTADRAAPEAEAETIDMVLDRLEEAGQDIEGFDEVIQALTDPRRTSVSRTMRDYLGESDHSAQLAQWLTKNPTEALRISRLEPAVAVKALEKAEARLAAAPKPAPKKVTGAPPPVSTVGGSSTASFDPNKAEMGDYEKWRRRQA